MDVLAAAREYTARGFFVVPIPKGQKGPRRKKWQELRLTDDQLEQEFSDDGNIGLLLGEPSGWLTDVDLDCDEAIRLAPDYLPPTGAITGRTGRARSHYWYRCEGAETSRHKDAAYGSTVVELRSTGLQTVVGPSIHPDGSAYEQLTGEPASVPYPMLKACVEALHQAVLKERGHDGEGPSSNSQNYVSGRLRPCGPILSGAVPVTDNNRDDGVLISEPEGSRPGDDYNQRGDLHALLMQHGWRISGRGSDGNYQLTRPGKTSGISATFKDGVFYLFSSSVPGFEPDRGYSPFEVYTRLEHHGDHSAAASALALQGYGSVEAGDYGVDLSGLLNRRTDTDSRDVGHSETDCGSNTHGVAEHGLAGSVRERDHCTGDRVGHHGIHKEHGVTHNDNRATETGNLCSLDAPPFYRPDTCNDFPEHLLNVPGFIGEYCDYTLRTSYARQPVLTLFGGICLQAALSARKLTDPFGNQTSLYVVCLVGSGKGKDRPRKVNREILNYAGAKIEGPEDLASDSGLLSVLSDNPGALLQLDEMGRLLKAASGAGEKAPHLYNINTLLLRLYSSVGSIYMGKAYGDARKNVEVHMPCPVIYGSTVPDSFWGSMSSESISDGFLARLIPVVGNESPEYATPYSEPIPERLIKHAQEWDRRTYGAGNLTALHPSPPVANYTPEAFELMQAKSVEWRERGDASDEWQPVWVRAAQKASRLALVYAASRSSESPEIDAEAFQWAAEVIEWSTSLYETHGTHKIADSEFERKCERVYSAIARKGTMTNKALCQHRAYKSLNQKERGEVMAVLIGDDRIAGFKADSGTPAWMAVGH